MPDRPLLEEDLLDYSPIPRNISLARHRAERLATDWGYWARADDIALVTSELMTNALLHGSLRDRLIRVRLTASVGSLLLEVSDPRGERQPVPRQASDDDQFGRGLTLVAALADDWGVHPRPVVGKTVWAQWQLTLTGCGTDLLTPAEKRRKWR